MGIGSGERMIAVVGDVLNYCWCQIGVGLEWYSFVGRGERKFITGAFGKKSDMGRRREGG